MLSARRYGTVLDEFRQLVTGGYGTPPGEIDAGVRRAVELLAGQAPALEDEPPSVDDVREAAEGLASSEEDLVLLAMFGEEAETLLQTIRQRHSREASLLVGDVDAQRGERIRELVKIVQESGVGEIEIEDEGMRVSVRRADEPGIGSLPGAAGVAVVETEIVDAQARRDRPGRSASSRRRPASSTVRRSRAHRPSSRSATSSHPARHSASSRR